MEGRKTSSINSSSPLVPPNNAAAFTIGAGKTRPGRHRSLPPVARPFIIAHRSLRQISYIPSSIRSHPAPSALGGGVLGTEPSTTTPPTAHSKTSENSLGYIPSPTVGLFFLKSIFLGCRGWPRTPSAGPELQSFWLNLPRNWDYLPCNSKLLMKP